MGKLTQSTAEIQSILNLVKDNQDAITDLDTIRENAVKGATALQSVPAEYVTETELQNAIANAITATLNTEV